MTLNVTLKRACCRDDALCLAQCLASTDAIYGIQGGKMFDFNDDHHHASGNCPINDEERARVVHGPLPKINPLCTPESPTPGMAGLYVAETRRSV